MNSCSRNPDHRPGCLLGQLAGDALGSLVEFQSGNPSMQERLELVCVQMTPDTRLDMLSATSGAEPAYTRTMLHAGVHPTFHRVQFSSLNKPGLGQPENTGIQVRVLHWCPPGRTLAGQLSTENTKEPPYLYDPDRIFTPGLSEIPEQAWAAGAATIRAHLSESVRQRLPGRNPESLKTKNSKHL